MNDMTDRNNMASHLPLATLRVINTKAVKDHALRCSKALRGGKFTRVGENFVNEVQADIEAFIREVANRNMPSVHEIVECPAEVCFVSGSAMNKLREAVDGMVARLVQSKVQRHPSLGCTLTNTR